ncbi:Putative ankyrin 2, isoform AA [Halyomorpha halys]|nr:Putative ankyrin 2, isoform AA [Halyomorpha halys]
MGKADKKHPNNTRDILRDATESDTKLMMDKGKVHDMMSNSRPNDDDLLHSAIEIGNIKGINELLERGAKVNSRGKDGSTPLHIAARKGYANIVNLLLEDNAKLDIRDKDSNAPIHLAVSNGHLNVVRALLDNGALINSRGGGGLTPLHIAVMAGHQNIIILLIERNASVNIGDTKNDAPIHYAVLNDKLHIVKTLLDRGALINSKGKSRCTPLHIAAKLGLESIVNLLLQRNASVDMRDMHNNAPIHDAVSNGNVNVVRALLDNGANINCQGEIGLTPIHIAAKKGYETVFNLLLERNVRVDMRDNLNDATIHHAIKGGNIEIIIKLLNHGANVNMKGANGNTPLILAVATDIIMMKTLVERGADVDSQNLYGQTALHHAAANGHDAAVVYLLSQNANLGIQDYICYAPLQWASYNGNLNIVKTLLDYGDDINRRGCHDITGLYLAIERNHSKLTDFFLSKNADTNVMSEEGKTPLDLAYSKSSAVLIKFLFEHGAKAEDESFLGSKILFNAISNKTSKLVKVLLNKTKHFESYPTVILNYAIGMRFLEGVDLLIKHRANIEKKDIHGNLPLSSAVKSKDVDIVNLILQTSRSRVTNANFTTFIDAYSDVKFINSQNNVTEIHNLTALHIASYYGLTDIARLLISHGALLEVKDERGYTPLHYSCEQAHVEVVKLLLNFEANKYSADINGTTPLHIACRLGSLSLAQLLLPQPPAALDYSDKDGYTALHYAALSGSQEIGNLLLNLDANKEAKTKDLKTPLHYASLEGHKEMAELLLKNGANSDAVDIDGMTPLHLAARERHSDMVKLLLGNIISYINENKNGDTPLHLACGRHDKSTRSEKDIVSMLANFNDVGPLNFNLMSPLHIGSRDNSTGCVEILLSKGADILRGDQFINRPIHYAALNGNSVIVYMLLRNNRGVSGAFNMDQETPLFVASREGHTDVVALLLEDGLGGLRPDVKGRTPLHRSASRGHFEIVKLIREHRANTEMEDKWGFTALNYAASWRGHQEVIGYLSTTLLNITLSHYLNISNPF